MGIALLVCGFDRLKICYLFVIGEQHPKYGTHLKAPTSIRMGISHITNELQYDVYSPYP